MKIVNRNVWISALLLMVTFLALTSTSLINTAGADFPIMPTCARCTKIVYPFDFTIIASPTVNGVFQGRSATFDVWVMLTSGDPTSVNLDLSGSPSGLTYSFSRSTVTPIQGYGVVGPQVILRVDASPDLAGGKYMLEISGTGAGVTRSKTVSLVVCPAHDTCIV